MASEDLCDRNGAGRGGGDGTWCDKGWAGRDVRGTRRDVTEARWGGSGRDGTGGGRGAASRDGATCTHHHQVDERNCVERDVPPVHEAHHVGDDHADGDQDDERGGEVEGEEQRDAEHGGEGDAQTDARVGPHGEVLLVVHVEDAAARETRGRGMSGQNVKKITEHDEVS